MMQVPLNISERIGNAEWTVISIGCSAARTFRLCSCDGSVMYLKVMNKAGKFSLQPEYERLEWLQGKLSVPQILDFAVEDEKEFLLTSEVCGVHAADQSWNDRLPVVVRELAKGLKAIHSIHVEGCPFDKSLSVRIREAELNVTAGLVNEDDFDIKRKGRKAADLFRELLEARPDHEDLVFTHGDYCLPNILISGESLSGFIDWGHAGIADRYQDIALAFRSFTFNFGEEWGRLFLQEYGLEEVDWRKVEYYQFLDEFF
ncbi:aminoglycoside 3'-phosphotransferase [Paenibacillus sp. sptzw28]|uniref:APH(3') family aminoglycoside O-phosphotransferase n=1 Tax=Paenibacillus sp. sptzw28 TaxID=715179 RepID=UPI001C6F373F|nr:APH(3') family aminoglycoside O-phosphotransferase [Paenibacillus sp. sptzw28]QYR22804.1 aminoglycoside 3'-phosphotransferase [Paenibacillus sp. sptzw28]